MRWDGTLINLDEPEYFLPNSKFCDSVDLMAQHCNEITKLLRIKAYDQYHNTNNHYFLVFLAYDRKSSINTETHMKSLRNYIVSGPFSSARVWN